MTDDTTQKPQPIDIKLPDTSQTARIALENVTPSKSPFDPKRTTSPLTAGAPAPTIRLKKPATAPVLSKPPTSNMTDAARGQGSLKAHTTIIRELPRDPDLAKRETSRIILRDITPSAPTAEAKRSTAPISGIPVSATGIPQTIRLKRPPTATAAAKVQDAAGASARARPSGDARLKSQTSRVVLDDAIKASAASDSRATSPIAAVPAAQPQTIRLKRPADALAVKTEAEAAVDEGAKSKTAKIDLPSAVVDATSPASLTQRKTIKIKRTERNVAPNTLVLKRSASKTAPEPAPAKEALAQAVPAAAAPTGLGWAFAAIAAAALVCAAGLAYLLAAQAFGPELQLPVPSFIL